MPTNVYFNHAVQSEQDLHEDLVVESLRFYGHECFYLPRTIVDEDELFVALVLLFSLPTTINFALAS